MEYRLTKNIMNPSKQQFLEYVIGDSSSEEHDQEQFPVQRKVCMEGPTSIDIEEEKKEQRSMDIAMFVLDEQSLSQIESTHSLSQQKKRKSRKKYCLKEQDKSGQDEGFYYTLNYKIIDMLSFVTSPLPEGFKLRILHQVDFNNILIYSGHDNKLLLFVEGGKFFLDPYSNQKNNCVAEYSNCSLNYKKRKIITMHKVQDEKDSQHVADVVIVEPSQDYESTAHVTMSLEDCGKDVRVMSGEQIMWVKEKDYFEVRGPLSIMQGAAIFMFVQVIKL